MLPSTRSALTAILRADPSVTTEARAAIVNAFSGKAEPSASGPAPARLLRRNEVARRFQVTPRCIDGWCKTGVLAKVTLPGHRRASGFRESDVADLIEGRTANPAA